MVRYGISWTRNGKPILCLSTVRKQCFDHRTHTDLDATYRHQQPIYTRSRRGTMTANMKTNEEPPSFVTANTANTEQLLHNRCLFLFSLEWLYAFAHMGRFRSFSYSSPLHRYDREKGNPSSSPNGTDIPPVAQFLRRMRTDLQSCPNSRRVLSAQNTG